MQFDTGIWAAAWDVYRTNWKTVACAIVAASAYDLFTQYMGESGGGSALFIEVLIWSLVAISAHGAVLLGATDLAFTDKRKLLMPFVGRSLVLTFLCLVAFLIALFAFEDRGGLWNLLKAALVMGLVALVIFALLGTWLPATVAGGNRGIGAAIDRAERTFFYSAARLLLGPGLLQAGFMAVGMVLLAILPGILTGDVFGAAGFSPADFLSLPVIYAVHAFTTTLLAVILSRAYLIAEQARALTSSS
jgi:hypothetical protein